MNSEKYVNFTLGFMNQILKTIFKVVIFINNIILCYISQFCERNINDGKLKININYQFLN